MRQIRFILEHIFLKGTILFFGLLPYESGHRLCGKAIGGLAYAIGGRYRKMIHKALTIGFPEFSEEKKQDLIRKTFRNLGHLAVEFAQLNDLHRWMDQHVDWAPETLEVLSAARDRKKGILLVTGHLGNWELICRLVTAKMGLPIHQIVAHQANPYGDRFVNGLRSKDDNIHLIYTGGASKHSLVALKKGETVGMAADQNARSRGIFIRFMNQPASTHVGRPGWLWPVEPKAFSLSVCVYQTVVSVW